MNAIAHLRPSGVGSPDPALVLAGVQAYPEGLAIVASGAIVYANPAWCRMFDCLHPAQMIGRTVGDLISRRSLSLVSGTGSPSVPEIARTATGSDKDRQDVSGLHIKLAKAGFHLRGSEFQVIHACRVARQEQTQEQTREQTEEERLEAQRLEAVGRLVGGVAHDFNNLLTGIMLYCDLLIGELASGSASRRHAEEMRGAGENGAALVQQLLVLSHPGAGASRVSALNEVVLAVEGLLNRLIGENIVLKLSLASDLGGVRMDAAKLQQILLNLVLNARDAMPDGGEITLSTRNCSTGPLESRGAQSQTTAWVELTVADNGCGMSAETLGRAFEPFFTTKRPGHGTGLGLATARRLAGQEGGTVVAQSEPGKGTQIHVRLPRVQTDTVSYSKEVNP